MFLTKGVTIPMTEQLPHGYGFHRHYQKCCLCISSCNIVQVSPFKSVPNSVPDEFYRDMHHLSHWKALPLILAKILIPGKVSSSKVMLPKCTEGDNIPPVTSHERSLCGDDPRVVITLLCLSRGRSREDHNFWSRRGSVTQNALQEEERGFSKHREFIKAMICKQGVSI